MESNEKKCTECGKTRPLEDFYRCKEGKFGSRGKCKFCMRTFKPVDACGVRSLKKMLRYRENRVQIRANYKEWYQENKEEVKKKRKLFT